ncbi:MAG: protein translocase subunit SecD [Dehalococcoidales bacterium]|nr:protein translocase subunit SecD [Dehalococcoidales bacterium]
MSRKNTLVATIILGIFILGILVVLPIEEGILGKRGVRLGLDLQGGVHIVYRADLSAVEPGGQEEALNSAVAILQNRVNPLGVTEPVIQIQGEDRIVVDLPGLSISDQDKERLARVDILEFGEKVSDNETAKWENELGKWKPATAVIDGEEKALTSRYFKTNTQVGLDNMSRIELHFEWNEEGKQLSEEITGRLIGEQLGIFDGNEPLRGESGRPIAPVVQAKIVDRGVITGLTRNDAEQLSRQLNFGRLPVPLEIVYDQTISPILGSDFIDMSVRAGLFGILMVVLFMILNYRLSGVLACLALAYYAVLVMALFKLIPVTLTLAGLGGFILSIGMAVDANVLIFARMKEEIRQGLTLGAAIEVGFDRAWSAIRDSNVTTLITCGVLYWVGSIVAAGAPVKGFALTLAIGVLISMFTAITVTRTLLRLFIGKALARRTRLFIS